MKGAFLLDTNVPSELTKPLPNPQVVTWVHAQETPSLYVSAVTVGELRKGFALLPRSKRRTQLEEWFELFFLPFFEDRVLPMTQRVGSRWGVLSAARQLGGTPLNTADGMIAATALEHGLTLVTRNTRDFAGLGLTLLNPWEDRP